MEVRTEVLEQSIRKTTLTSNIVSIFLAIISALGVGFGFYFNTRSQLDSHEIRIQEVQKDVKQTKDIVTEIQVFKGVSSSEMQNLDKKVDKIDEKLDKLLMLQKGEK
jgi:uncharacterized protein HemX